MAGNARSDLSLLRMLADLAYCNPFSPERIDFERQILGPAFVDDSIAWSRKWESVPGERPNVLRLTELASQILERCRDRWHRNASSPTPQSLHDYWDVLTYVLIYRHVVQYSSAELDGKARMSEAWQEFLRDYRRLTDLPEFQSQPIQSPEHLFACLVQVHRAFLHIYDYIIGDSAPIIALRAKVWQSLFTRDMRRYRQSLYERMRDATTLIVGPTGTGKELVARAIGQSQFVPFNPVSQRFVGSRENSFVALNIAALSPTLIESELFGHRRGAFTGAISDRVGWLESCPAFGAVFLDEIGELDLTLQVKLLRVAQQRVYTRLGDTREQQFAGKIIVATNRNLQQEIAAGRFREDLFYRLCSDVVETPSLREQLADRPDDLRPLVGYISQKVAGPEGAEALTDYSVAWIERHLGAHYAWPGNIRELEQCIRGLLIRGEYSLGIQTAKSEVNYPIWMAGMLEGSLSAEELLRRYSTWVYSKLGSYEQTAQRLGLDRRTIKAKVDGALLERLRGHRAVGESGGE